MTISCGAANLMPSINENNTNGIQRSVVLLLTPGATTKKNQKKYFPISHAPETLLSGYFSDYNKARFGIFR